MQLPKITLGSSTAILVTLILLLTGPQPVLAINDYGEAEDYLGQIVDDYENDDNIAALIDTINNETLDCMELNYSIRFTFLDYTEGDSANDITVTAKKVEWDTMRRDADAYVYYDYGAGYFGDFNMNYTLNLSDIEAGDADTRTVMYAFCLADDFGSMIDIIAGGNNRLILEIRQVGSTDDVFIFRLQQVTGESSDFIDDTAQQGIGTFYITMTRVGTTINCKIYSDEARTVLIDTLTDGGNGDGTTYQYLQPMMSLESGTDGADHSTGYVEWEFEPSYAKSGTYYTVNVLDGDPAIAILYNLTIPTGTGATMEFSTDNMTWVDHNNQAGNDTLIAGYNALDLRDIYNGTLYRRVNMTSDGENTTRMYQERLVTVTEVVAEGDTIIMGGSGVFWIILIIVVPIVAYMVKKK